MTATGPAIDPLHAWASEGSRTPRITSSSQRPGSTAITRTETSASPGLRGRERRVDRTEGVEVGLRRGSDEGLHLQEPGARRPRARSRAGPRERAGAPSRAADREPRASGPGSIASAARAGTASSRVPSAICGRSDRPERRTSRVLPPTIATMPTAVTASASSSGNGRGSADPGGLMVEALCSRRASPRATRRARRLDAAQAGR